MYVVAYRFHLTFYSYENQLQYDIEGEREFEAAGRGGNSVLENEDADRAWF